MVDTTQAETAAQNTPERATLHRQVLQGTVRSNKMQKTVIVEVSERVLHPEYKKYVTRRRRYMAHDERNECLPGDVVRIQSTRPLSRHKRWRVTKLIERPA